MIPQIFTIGPLPINSFGLMIALAMIVAIYRLQYSFKVNGIDPSLAEKYVFLGGLSGLFGARVWYLIRHYPEIKDHFWQAAFSGAGFTFYGGFIIAAIVVYISLVRDKIQVSKFIDSLGPALCIAYAIGRVGCQLSGDGDYGVATDTIFGMSYATGAVPTLPGVKVFPAPVYESILSVIVFYFLTKIEVRNSWIDKPYSRFGIYLILMSLERFIVEFVRIEKKFALGLSEAHYVAMFLAVIGVLLMVFSKKKRD